MCTFSKHCSSISRHACISSLEVWNYNVFFLQNIVVVYRDIFVPLITTCVLLQNIVVVYCDIFVPLCRKSGKAEAQNQMGQSVTHASIQPTQSPSWEEILLVEFREENSKDEGWLSGKFYSFLCNTVHVPLLLSYKPFEKHEKTHKEIELSERDFHLLKVR